MGEHRSTGRQEVSSGYHLEDEYGYCRAVRVGARVEVGGTAPVWPDGTCDPDAGAQAVRCLEIIANALAQCGAGADDVIRSRMYITDVGDADSVGRAHGRFFERVRPVATMVVVAGLVDPRWKVEIEVEAEIGA